jgi:hypothetical protein
MGKMKNDWIDEQSAKYEKRRWEIVADYLGLTSSEVEEANPEFHEIETEDGMQVGWEVRFPEGTKQETLTKLGGEKTHRFDLHVFDDNGEDPEESIDGGFIDLPTDFVKRTAEDLKKQKDENKED